MAEYVSLPAATYHGDPSASQVRGKGRHLNTIIEEENEDMSPKMAANSKIRGRLHQRQQHHYQQYHQGSGPKDNLKIEQWLSPLSDHFPTPRGFHFLAAPILPSSPSATSAEESNSPQSSSTNPSDPWKRSSVVTDATDFEDLDIYDVSDDEEEKRKQHMRTAALQRQHSGRTASSGSSRRSLPKLAIPHRPISPDLKKIIASPVAPTPTAKVPMSPAMMNFMHVQHSLEVPGISAPPSLDGSFTSEQLAQMSAPPTPVIACKDENEPDWGGVHLQPGALATLHALSSPNSDVDFSEQPEQVLEVPSPQDIPMQQVAELPARPAPREEMSEMRQRPLRLITALTQRERSSVILSPAQQRSLAGLTQLDIPSPGGFFSGLSPRTRHTWHMPTPVEENAPPTSTTAEQFYKLPWHHESAPPLPSLPPPPPRPLHMAAGNFSNSPVEHVVEVERKPEDDPLTATRVQPTPEPVTARRVPLHSQTSTASATLNESSSPTEDVTANEIVVDYDPEYTRKQHKEALTHLGRTELWLMAQRAYLKGVDVMPESPEEARPETAEPEEKEKEEEAPTPPPKDNELQGTSTALVRKKTVRFSEPVKSPNLPRSLPSKLLHQESAYYRAFTDHIIRTQQTDVFVHRLPRFEALQAQRASLRDQHRNQLLGKYQLSVVPQSAKKRMSANVVRGDDVLVDDPAKLRADKEADAYAQMQTATWHVAALRLLNGGRLIAAPVHKRLARQSRMAAGADRARILDLGGLATADWAWHAALQYPNTKIYSVTTKAIRQMSNANIRGPPNHRQVAVDRLTRLPFADNQFDLVRAAELHSILKFVGENGADEWEACLAEIIRVLKPGGYIEFQVLDSDIMNAGPRGNAKSVEFGFALKTLGYDPAPTKLFTSRLRRAGFEDTKRAWMCLPVGPKPASASRTPVVRDSAGLPVPTVEMEAMVSGSADHVAAVTGLAAGWSWERWLLRAEMEKAAGELRLADIATGATDAVREAGKSLADVHEIIEEGRTRGAGWRVLRGYARKPRRAATGIIDVVLDTDSLC